MGEHSVEAVCGGGLPWRERPTSISITSGTSSLLMAGAAPPSRSHALSDLRRGCAVLPEDDAGVLLASKMLSGRAGEACGVELPSGRVAGTPLRGVGRRVPSTESGAPWLVHGLRRHVVDPLGVHRRVLVVEVVAVVIVTLLHYHACGRRRAVRRRSAGDRARARDGP